MTRTTLPRTSERDRNLAAVARRRGPEEAARGLLLALAVALCAAFAATAAWGQEQPNVLLVIVDDWGIEHASPYDVGDDPVFLPTIESLAAAGTRYENFWVNPLCSPTRALLLTGRWGYETGVGRVVQDDQHSLDPALETLPELLAADGYATGLFGKWHLGYGDQDSTPVVHGFDRYEGPLLQNQLEYEEPSYYLWKATEVSAGGTPENTEVTEYMTSWVIDATIDWIGAQAGPWFAVVGSPAAHLPFEAPPPELHTQTLDTGSEPREIYRAMLEAFDTELARLLAAAPEAHVIVVSDNGSPVEVVDPPFSPQRAKGTLAEGGIRVPCFISSPLMPPGVVTEPASAVDLFATVLSWASVPAPPGQRGVALPAADPDRIVYAERFAPNGTEGLPESWNMTARNAEFKLVRTSTGGGRETLFYLAGDPYEQVPLDPTSAYLPDQARQAYEELALFLDARLFERALR